MQFIEFTKVKLPYGFLGNMYPSPLLHQGKIWQTSEALFQALRFDDETIREIIRNDKSPMGAKMKAKRFKNSMNLTPMSSEDLENMRMVVRLKFDQHADLKRMLMGTGDYMLIENVGNRNGERHLFWGMKRMNGEWMGKNKMGQILMELREHYRNN
jgi:ribA/ribD-fused uncharacterized protein